MKEEKTKNRNRKSVTPIPSGKDEWYCMWFECPACHDKSIADGFNFCQECGLRLNWPKKQPVRELGP